MFMKGLSFPKLRYYGYMKRIAIIGAGASGLAAAVSAAQVAAQKAAVTPDVQQHFEIYVFEAADRVGKSILASGNGRCNFSNSLISADTYHNTAFVDVALSNFPPTRVLEWFQNLGLTWVEDSEGRLYPLSNKASSVLDVLRFALEDYGVKVQCNTKVSEIIPVQGGYHLSFASASASAPAKASTSTPISGDGQPFDSVIVACGGKTASSILPHGYHYSEPKPLLGPLKTDIEKIKGLNNIRVKCAVSCQSAGTQIEERGEVLFRDYGVSGIAIFNLSRYIAPGDKLNIDFLPNISEDEVPAYIQKRYSALGMRTAQKLLAGMLQKEVARAVLKSAELNPEKPLQQTDLPRLATALKHFTLEIKGIADPRQCQVSRGGFAVDSFDPHTMESRFHQNLYLVGEALDVDAPCGGYNLHWAWTSGVLAATSSINLR